MFPCFRESSDILSATLRTTTRLATGQFLSSSGGIAANAFDGNLATACTQTFPGGYLQIQLTSPDNPVIFGIYPNGVAPGQSYSVRASTDGITFVTLATFPDPPVAQQWQWIDVQGVPASGYTYFRLQASAPTLMDIS